MRALFLPSTSILQFHLEYFSKNKVCDSVLKSCAGGQGSSETVRNGKNIQNMVISAYSTKGKLERASNSCVQSFKADKELQVCSYKSAFALTKHVMRNF